MAFFQSAVGTLQTLVVALGAGLGIWGAINLMEGYGNDNPGAKIPGNETADGWRWSGTDRNDSRTVTGRSFLRNSMAESRSNDY